MKFHTGAHFTKQWGGSCLILKSLKWLRVIIIFQWTLHHSSPPWQWCPTGWLSIWEGSGRQSHLLPAPSVCEPDCVIPPRFPSTTTSRWLQVGWLPVCVQSPAAATSASLETNLEMARNIEVATREQNVSVEWHRVRKNRITSSRFREICHVRGQSSAERLAERIKKGVAQTALMKRGLALEPVAIQEYCRVKTR